MKKTKEHARVSIFKDVYSRVLDADKESLTRSLLSSKVATSEDVNSYINKNFKLNFFNGSKYNPKEYRADKDKAIAFYNSKGFRDAKIQADSIYKFSEDKINVDISLVEGNKYYYRNISFTGTISTTMRSYLPN